MAILVHLLTVQLNSAIEEEGQDLGAEHRETLVQEQLQNIIVTEASSSLDLRGEFVEKMERGHLRAYLSVVSIAYFFKRL